MAIEPFRIQIPDADLADLRDRLARTRWPSEVAHSGWTYGANLTYLQELVAYWRDTFDWRKQEAQLNRLHHYRADVDGLRIHFIHERGHGPSPLPLILTHGWPGSFYELHKVIGPLTDPAAHGGDPADAFDVVAPSLPGYGFSEIPTIPGIGVERTADLWAALMTQLGYPRFGAQGGDWGAIVSACLGQRHPQRLIGIHTNMIGVAPTPRTPMTDEEKAFLDAARRWRHDEAGYQEIQGTRPQTLAYALTDSPAGLAAWIVEKWRAWSDCGGDVERRFTKDELLTNIAIYWFTGTANSAARYYYEGRNNQWRLREGERIEAPCGFAVFPHEINRPPRSWVERACNVQRWTVMPRGGHFAAMEEPSLLVDDIRAFFRPLRGR